MDLLHSRSHFGFIGLGLIGGSVARCIENEILMFLRKTSKLRLEVSLDEPLKTDWDGN